MNEFLKCSQHIQSKKEALGCCMTECRNDIQCQEHCIESYNKLIPVHENFILNLLGANRGAMFAVLAAAAHLSTLLGVVPTPIDPRRRVAYVVLGYFLVYWAVYRIL